MKKSVLRKPHVAGQFYPSSASALRKQIESFLAEDTARLDAISCMLPHAGYIYSGQVAAKTISRINLKDTTVILGPNHTGFGAPMSIMSEGTWQTPLGEIPIHSELAENILEHSEGLTEDTLAHMYEHSLEVELPFLQYFKPDIRIVPIVLHSDNLQELQGLGKAVAAGIKELGLENSTLIIASSDMTHYEPKAQAEKKDRQAIEAILDLDERKLIQVVQDLNISMCGVAPVAAMLYASKQLGAKRAQLVAYQTSADASGDTESVVGYAGIIVYE